MTCIGSNNCQEHVKQIVFFRRNLVFMGLSRDIQCDIKIPFNFQFGFVEELLFEISGNFTNLLYINCIYFLRKKN